MPAQRTEKSTLSMDSGKTGVITMMRKNSGIEYRKSSGILLAGLLILSGCTTTQSIVTYPSDENVADGSRLKVAYDYRAGDDPPVQGLLPGVSRPHIAAMVEDQVQDSALPPGFSFGESETIPVMQDARAREIGIRSFGPSEDKREKFITLHSIDYRGVPLAEGSDFLSIVAADGRLLVTRKRGLPLSVGAVEPTVSKQTAIGVASEDFGPGQPLEETSRLEIWVDESDVGHLTWSIAMEASSLTNPKAIRYWVSATGSARILHKENQIFFNHNGNVTGTPWAAASTGGTVTRPLRELDVTRSDGAVEATDVNGGYLFTSGGGTATMTAALDGPNVDVQNQAGADMGAANNGTPAAPVDLAFNATTDLQRAEVSANYWVNQAHDLASPILDAADLPNLPALVNISGNCNAFWTGSSVLFYQAFSGCPNTAYSDVIYHEYGHGVDDRKGGILDGGLSEGFGDAIAILGTRQSCVGRSFRPNGDCLREASEVHTWPPPAGTGSHDTGRRYGGFTWELIQQLLADHSQDDAYAIATQLTLASAAANPSDIPDAVHLTFVADDDDANLATCSPNQKALEAAADSRTIPRPANCAMVCGGGPVVAASANFSWAPAKKVSSNSNILEVQVTLPQAMEVHISANSSAKSTNPLNFRTGFYNQPQTNVMWTYSYRQIDLAGSGKWSNFGSMIGLNLPAGTHTVYWKIWISGSELELSAGSLLVEAFPATTPFAGTPAETEIDASGVVSPR